MSHRTLPVCRTCAPPGETLSFDLFLDDKPFEERAPSSIGDFLARLSTVVQPLELSVELATRLEGDDEADPAMRPAQSFYLLREVGSDSTTELRMSEPPQLVLLPAIEPVSVRAFLERALAQPAPAPDRVVTLDAIACDTIRARLVQEPAREAAMLYLLDRGEKSAVSIEHRADGDWVKAPSAVMQPTPPLTFEIQKVYGKLTLILRVCWSFWTDGRFPEHQGLIAALKALMTKGWIPRTTSPLFPFGR